MKPQARDRYSCEGCQLDVRFWVETVLSMLCVVDFVGYSGVCLLSGEVLFSDAPLLRLRGKDAKRVCTRKRPCPCTSANGAGRDVWLWLDPHASDHLTSQVSEVDL